MRIWKLLPFAVSLGLVVVLVACRTPHRIETSTTTVPAELVQPAYLYEVARHLYRWYLDEAEVERLYQRLKTVGHLDQKSGSDDK